MSGDQKSDEVHSVLSIIDQSLKELKTSPSTIDLKSIDNSILSTGVSSAQGKLMQLPAQQRGTVDATFINDLTVDLLSEQKKTAILENENARLREQIAKLQQAVANRGMKIGVIGSNLGGSSRSSAVTSSIRANVSGSVDRQSRGRLGKELSSIVSSIHAQVDRQSELIKQKHEDGMCSLGHRDIQSALDRCLSQLSLLRDSDRATQKQQTDLEDRTERYRDRLEAAEMEIQFMQEQRSTLNHQLEAFEAENMRLTNQVDELRFTVAQQQRLQDSPAYEAQSKSAGSNKDVQQLLQMRETDAKRIADLEMQCRKLQNELDEMANLQAEKEK